MLGGWREFLDPGPVFFFLGVAVRPWSATLSFPFVWRRSVGRTVGRTVGQSDGRSVGRTVGRSVGQSVRRSDGSVGRTVGRSVGRVGRSVGRPARRDAGAWSVLKILGVSGDPLIVFRAS